MKKYFKKYRRLIVALSCCLFVVIFPVQSKAEISLSFNIFSVGPFSLKYKIPLPGVFRFLGGAVAVAGTFICFFNRTSGGSYSNSYSASYYDEKNILKPKCITVSIKANDHIKGKPLKIKFHDIINDNKIYLKNGFLSIEDDGKMVFTDVDFKGYMYLHYDKKISIWDEQNNPVLILEIDEGNNLLIIQEKSIRASRILNIIL